MKKILALLLVLALMFSVVACGSETESEEPATEGEETEATEEEETSESEESDGMKVLKLLEAENIPSLVTWKATDTVSFTILGNINSGLVNLTPEKTLTPDLAESWEVSEDGLKYTFHLRDANWVTIDGEVYGKVTADDFIYAWKKLVDPKEASQYSFLISTASIKNGKEAVHLSELLVGYDTAKNNFETMDVSDFNDIPAATPEEQLADAKTVLEQELADAADEETKKAIQEKIDALKVEDYEAIEAVSAQTQFDEAKAAAEDDLATTKAALEEEYGSVEEAQAKVTELIDSMGVSAPDENTLVVELSNPVPYFVELMTFPSLFPVNGQFADEKGDAYGTNVENFLYNGAFIFKDWKISEKHYLEKNPEYWDAENVKLDAVDYRVVEGVNNDTAVQMYLDGELHRTGLSGENVEKYGNRPDTQADGEATLFYIQVNHGSGPDTANKRLLALPSARKALNMGFDKSYITDQIFKNGSLPVDFFLPKSFVTDPNGKDFREVAEELYEGGEGYNRYNVEEAQKLWEDAKKEAGMQQVELELIVYQGETSSKVAAHIKDELEKNLSGLTITINALPFAEKIKRANEGDFELDYAGWGPDYPDAMTFMDMWVTGGGHNTLGYSNPAYDEIIERSKNGDLTVPEKIEDRFKALVESEKILLEDDQAIIPLYQRGLMSLVNPAVQNMVNQVYGPDFIFKYVDLVEE